MIQSVQLKEDIEAGKELFTNYGYQRTANANTPFPWYFELEEKILKEEEAERKRLKKLEREKQQSQKKKKSKKAKNVKKV